ncbi:hypothetical protein [Pseudomonas fluorescens]|uniref:Uncharacterized protein n=1 Tax=Pseudomonas fluorescens TaxID=294 RepID=A0A5E7D352_PSEFL|nr:hypothetical protein [Pseudomonas fluorescens]VVO11869.1 hypothetical protein PS691_03471 [Pseudomonas fluorescens]
MTSSTLVTGRKIRRRAYQNVPTRTSVTWLLSASEAQLFEGWFEHVLISGTLPFECPLKSPLWLLKRPLIDAEWVLIAPEYILMSSIFDRAMNQEWPRHLDE